MLFWMSPDSAGIHTYQRPSTAHFWRQAVAAAQQGGVALFPRHSFLPCVCLNSCRLKKQRSWAALNCVIAVAVRCRPSGKCHSLVTHKPWSPKVHRKQQACRADAQARPSDHPVLGKIGTGLATTQNEQSRPRVIMTHRFVSPTLLLCTTFGHLDRHRSRQTRYL